MTSRVAVRIAGLILAIGVVWYITHLNAEIARIRASSSPGAAPAPGERPAAPAPAAAPPPAAAPAGPRSISTEQHQAMLEKLGAAPGSPVWFATVPNNPEAATYKKALQKVFEEAGWQVKGNSTVKFA